MSETTHFTKLFWCQRMSLKEYCKLIRHFSEWYFSLERQSVNISFWKLWSYFRHVLYLQISPSRKSSWQISHLRWLIQNRSPHPKPVHFAARWQRYCICLRVSHLTAIYWTKGEVFLYHITMNHLEINDSTNFPLPQYQA